MLTPHVGFKTQDSLQRLAQATLDNLRCFGELDFDLCLMVPDVLINKAWEMHRRAHAVSSSVPVVERLSILRNTSIDGYDTLDELGNLIVSRLEHCPSLSKLWTTSVREFEEELPNLIAKSAPRRRVARRGKRRGSLRPV